MNYTKDSIIKLLKTNVEFDRRCMIKLYNRMEADEKASRSSVHENGRGFSKYDAKLLCEISEKIINNQVLTSKEIAQMRYRIVKYSEQILEIIEEEKAKNKKDYELHGGTFKYLDYEGTIKSQEKEYEQITIEEYLEQQKRLHNINNKGMRLNVSMTNLVTIGIKIIDEDIVTTKIITENTTDEVEKQIMNKTLEIYQLMKELR